MANESFITYKEPEMTVSADEQLWFYKGSWFDPKYNNTMWFASQKGSNSQWHWFDTNREPTISQQFRYAIKSMYEVDFRVPYSTDDLFETSYVCRIKNYGKTNEKRLMYFIDSIDAYSPNMSIVHCTLDVIQTFMFEWKLGTQHTLRTNGRYLASIINDERCFTNEDFAPDFEECSKSQIVDPLISPNTETGYIKITDLPFKGHALTKQVYLVIATQYFDYYQYHTVGQDFEDSWHSVSYMEFANTNNQNPKDANQLFYLVFENLEKLSHYLWMYSPDLTKSGGQSVDNAGRLNAIKGIYGIPLICAGVKAVDQGDPEIPSSIWSRDLYDNVGDFCGYRVKSVANKIAINVDFPTSFYGYTPYVNKTRTYNCLSIESRSGKSVVLKANELDWTLDNGTYKLTLTIEGICSTEPKVLAIPHSLPETSLTTLKTTNYFSTSVSPTFTIFNASDEQIYNKNYETAMNKESLSAITSAITMGLGIATTLATGGATAPLMALGAGVAGVSSYVGSRMERQNMKETYKPPQNMIGSAESSDIWVLDMGYIVLRWLSPTFQNMKSFDKTLATNGYNCSGDLIDLGLQSGTNQGSGFNMFGRNCFCYVQTLDCNIGSGNLGIYKNRIESIFNNGIRFWNVSNSNVNTYGIGNYTTAVLRANES